MSPTSFDSRQKITWIPEMLGLLGDSANMRDVWSQVERFSLTDCPTLITGEAGTGKELVAKALHQLSSRKDSPFLALSTACVEPEEKMQELFGYQAPDVSAASTECRGRLEQASEGSLFLDELVHLSRAVQSKLLRYLETHSFERPGAGKRVEADCRLMFSSRTPFEKLSEQEDLARELVDALGTSRIHLPPLRERKGDIEKIARHHLELFGRELGKPGLRLSAQAALRMDELDWPGNVRQLIQVVKKLVILAEEPEIAPERIVECLRKDQGPNDPTNPDIQVGMSLMEARIRLTRATLATMSGNTSQTAHLLGVDRKTVTKYGQWLPRNKVSP